MSDSLNVKNSQETSYDGDTALDSALLAFDQGFANTGMEYLEWNDPDIDFTSFLNPQANEKTSQYPSLGSPSLAHSSTPSANRAVQVQQLNSSAHASIPGAPSLKFRSLKMRSQISSGPQRIANLIFQTLKSYPLMMMRHKTLPPFIHPHLISPDDETANMEPLNNCISLVHMISSGVRGSRKLFWKVVRLECEQLHEKVH